MVLERKKIAAKKNKRAPFVSLSFEDAELLKIFVAAHERSEPPLTYSQLARRVAADMPEWDYGRNARIILRHKIKGLERFGLVARTGSYPESVCLNPYAADEVKQLCLAATALCGKLLQTRGIKAFAETRAQEELFERIASK